jgi:hypothetical protein
MTFVDALKERLRRPAARAGMRTKNGQVRQATVERPTLVQAKHCHSVSIPAGRCGSRFAGAQVTQKPHPGFETGEKPANIG